MNAVAGATPPSASSASLLATSGLDADLAPWRLNLLRAIYALIGLAQGANMVSVLASHPPGDRGVIPSLLFAMCALDLIGIRYPTKMLPLLLFEWLWKTTWFAVYGLPQWLAHTGPPTFAEDFPAITLGVILMPLVLPWGHVWRQYLAAPGEMWRRGS